jgi:hypothetical protein
MTRTQIDAEFREALFLADESFLETGDAAGIRREPRIAAS